MELTVAQNDAIYNQVRKYYQHFANDLGIVNPPADLVQFGDVLVQAIKNLGLGERLPLLSNPARRITHAPLPTTSASNMASVVDRSVLKYLQELGLAVDPGSADFYRQTNDINRVAKHIDEYIAALKRTPIAVTNLKTPTLPASPRSLLSGSVPSVVPSAAVGKIAPPRPIAVPRLPVSYRRSPLSPSYRPNSPVLNAPLNATARSLYNAEPLPDISSRLAARSDEVAKILGISEEQLLASLYRMLPQGM